MRPPSKSGRILRPFHSVLKLERLVSREGIDTVGCNAYRVPDAIRAERSKSIGEQTRSASYMGAAAAELVYSLAGC